MKRVAPGRPLLAACRIFAVSLPAVACATSASAPWDAQPSSGVFSLQARHADLEVRCDECTVTFAVGGQVEEVRMRGLWTTRLSYYYRSGQIALTAVPTSVASSVEKARIVVDGSVVAEAGAGPGERVDLAAELRSGGTPR